MDDREKLVEQAISHFWYGVSHDIFSEPVITYAKLAIEALKKENGVTVQKSSCPYCCDNGEGHGMMKHSYDDEDGMEMSIHPSTRKENGYQSQAWWATVHFRGECRDFYIEVCPFCGRRLVPLKEERETAMPQPPKGE